MMFGPLARISPSDAIFTWTPGIGLPTVPNLGRSYGLNASTGDVSVSPYPDGHEPRAVEEPPDFGGERRASRHEQLDAPAGARAQLREHQPVRDRVPDCEAWWHRDAREAVGGPLLAHPLGPQKNLALQGAARERGLEH